MVMDDDWARRVLDAQSRGQDVAAGADPERMSPLHYTPEVAYLSAVVDGLRLVRSAIFATAGEGSSEPPFDPLPRPETALDAERERRAIAELNELDRMIRGV